MNTKLLDVDEKIIKTRYEFDNNHDIDSHEYAIVIIEKESNNMLFYAKFYDRDLMEAYMSTSVYKSPKLIKDIAFYMNLKIPFFNKIYKYYV